MNNPQFYPSDFEPQASRGLLVFVGVVLSLSALSTGTVMGYELRDWQQREHERQAKANPKPRPVVANPANLIRCEDPIRSREEVARICRSRLRSTEIGK